MFLFFKFHDPYGSLPAWDILWVYDSIAIFFIWKNYLKLDRFQKDIENIYGFNMEPTREDSAVCSVQEIILKLQTQNKPSNLTLLSLLQSPLGSSCSWNVAGVENTSFMVVTCNYLIYAVSGPLSRAAFKKFTIRYSCQ